MKGDFWCGIESGFPLCCIDFFINFWCPVRESKFMFSGRPECYDWNLKYDIGHIQCPDCIINGVTNAN